ncbi:MAG: M56 family metallopeptidase [Sphingomicrobium sp.]
MTNWLVGTLIASSGLMLLVLVLRIPVRRLFGPRVTYALWLLPALRMILPSLPRTVERVGPSAATGPLAMPAPGAAFAPTDLSLVEQLGGWPAILIAVWLAGAAILLLRGLRIYRHQRAAILRSSVRIATLDGISILRSECIGGPLALGMVKRFIALPLDFDTRFSDRERRLALEHELAHHRSGDLVANTIAFVLLCLQWFNPLAWAAHAAFRFDQEAACDARVLDKADVADRSSYGEAIAKAASGRTLLFAGALDRPSTLSRRLTIMTNISNSRARIMGFTLLGGAVLIALPLTATWAVQYVDTAAAPSAGLSSPTLASMVVPASALPAAAAGTPAVPAIKLATLAPLSASLAVGRNDIDFIGNDTVRINGVTKRWDQLTTDERNRIRVETAEARAQLGREEATVADRIADARQQVEKFRNGDFQREMAESRVEMQRSLAEIDREAKYIRMGGQDPEAIKADIRRSLKEIEQMDIDKIVREAMAGVDENTIRSSLDQARKSLDDIDTKLNRLDGR